MKKIDVSKATRVNYELPSKGRTLEYNGIYVTPKRLVNGNSKLVNILIFDLTAIASCLNCASCKATCYAVKAERQYVDTKIFRDTNLSMAKNDLYTLKLLIVKQLNNTKVTSVRIHSSGDFFSQYYIDFWSEIIALYPNIQFYAYTKVGKLLNFTQIETNKNFNLINSLIENKVLNYGSLDYCNELNKTYDTFICPATKKRSEVKCGKDCFYCITKKNVCFIQH